MKEGGHSYGDDDLVALGFRSFVDSEEGIGVAVQVENVVGADGNVADTLEAFDRGVLAS